MRRMIAVGALTPGSVVPSVRELAQQLRVNPNTVARAYQRLTEAGVLAVRRGEGTFVCDRPAPVKSREKAEALRDGAARYASTAVALGLSIEEATAALEDAYESFVNGERRKK